MLKVFSFELYREVCSLKTQCSKSNGSFWSGYCKLILAFFWVAGLFAGLVLLKSAGPESKAYLRAVGTLPCTYKGFLVSNLVPPVVLCLCLVWQKPLGFISFFFIRGMLLSYIFLGTMEASSGLQVSVFHLITVRLIIGIMELHLMDYCNFGESEISFSEVFLFLSLIFLLICFNISVIFPIVGSF